MQSRRPLSQKPRHGFYPRVALRAAMRSRMDKTGAASSRRTGTGSVVVAGAVFVVVVGGEPLLQVDEALVQALHALGFEIAVESNGTVLPPAGIDWLCISPKAGSQRVVNQGQELKLVYPQIGAEPEQFEALQFEHFYLQPMDGPHAAANTAAAVAYAQAHPRWKLSLQTHKLIGIP